MSSSGMKEEKRESEVTPYVLRSLALESSMTRHNVSVVVNRLTMTRYNVSVVVSRLTYWRDVLACFYLKSAGSTTHGTGSDSKKIQAWGCELGNLP